MGTHFLEKNEEEQVRATKESGEREGAHFLESVERGTGQDNERKCATEGLSPLEERRGRDKSGQ
jgi:hypothetical protein